MVTTDFAGKTISIDRNIDLSGYNFTPIGGVDKEAAFQGTFDGQGNTIAGLTQNGWELGYEYGETAGMGLFGWIGDATIKNVTIDAAEVSMEAVVMGTVAGYAAGDCTFENISVFVRTVFAFEAADLDINKFHEIMYIKLNQDVYTDDRTVCWDYPADTKWIEMTDGGKRYYMLVATYCKPLSANMTTSPSLLKVGFESSATNESLKVFGDTYEMMAKTQAISVSSYAEGTAPNYALNDAFGKITSTNHPWKGISN